MIYVIVMREKGFKATFEIKNGTTSLNEIWEAILKDVSGRRADPIVRAGAFCIYKNKRPVMIKETIGSPFSYEEIDHEIQVAELVK